MATAISDLLRAFHDLPLLRPAQRQELDRLQRHCSDPQALVQNLVQKGWLTAFQAKYLLRGQASSLLLGSYILLDCLGEGGMGQVFKARNWKLDRLAAVKVLRKELVTDNEILERFLREMMLASQLDKHPHLVHAFDAGPIGSTYFLAMEYIEGIDLDQLVQKTGPLSIEQACTYIQQASLGLQHVHEHGLIHRDIKPANLLVTPRPPKPGSADGTVKLLDLGLARLQGNSSRPGQTVLSMAADDSLTLGTIDYISPEQALDFHRADIRSDIYSLGCTFFYLLTGKPPFGEGPMTVKLMRHQQAAPPDLKERRPDIPDNLLPILGRMLAKRPADRFQTPGEVASALTGLQQPKAKARAPRRFIMAAAVVGMLLLLPLLGYALFRPAARPTEAASATAETVRALPPPAPDSVEATVPEAREYQLVYDLNLAKLSRDIVYDEDRQAKISQGFDRIAYFIELRRHEGELQYLYVSMNAFTTDLKKIGVPTMASGASFQMNVASMNVYSNVTSIVTGNGITTGNIEFWPNNYGPANTAKVPNANSSKYDFGDQLTPPHDGYGSMQVHNYEAKQTLFAVNHWRTGNGADIGIGNNPSGNPDWTFSGNAGSYRQKRLRVLVRCR